MSPIFLPLIALAVLLSAGCDGNVEKIMPPGGAGGDSGPAGKPERFEYQTAAPGFATSSMRLKSLGSVRWQEIECINGAGCEGVVSIMPTRSESKEDEHDQEVLLRVSDRMRQVLEEVGLIKEGELTNKSFVAFVGPKRGSSDGSRELVVIGASENVYVYATHQSEVASSSGVRASEPLRITRSVISQEVVHFELSGQGRQKGKWRLSAMDFEYLSDASYYTFSKRAEPFQVLQQESSVIGVLVDDKKHLLFMRQD